MIRIHGRVHGSASSDADADANCASSGRSIDRSPPMKIHAQFELVLICLEYLMNMKKKDEKKMNYYTIFLFKWKI